MKSFALLAILVLLFTGLHAQELDAPKQERMFLPSDTLWGYAQFDVAPPHNEIDPNLCASNAGNFGGANFFDYRALGDPVNTAARLDGTGTINVPASWANRGTAAQTTVELTMNWNGDDSTSPVVFVNRHALSATVGPQPSGKYRRANARRISSSRSFGSRSMLSGSTRSWRW